jgi:hypothetical protein
MDHVLSPPPTKPTTALSPPTAEHSPETSKSWPSTPKNSIKLLLHNARWNARHGKRVVPARVGQNSLRRAGMALWRVAERRRGIALGSTFLLGRGYHGRPSDVPVKVLDRFLGTRWQCTRFDPVAISPSTRGGNSDFLVGVARWSSTGFWRGWRGTGR